MQPHSLLSYPLTTKNLMFIICLYLFIFLSLTVRWFVNYPIIYVQNMPYTWDLKLSHGVKASVCLLFPRHSKYNVANAVKASQKQIAPFMLCVDSTSSEELQWRHFRVWLSSAEEIMRITERWASFSVFAHLSSLPGATVPEISSRMVEDGSLCRFTHLIIIFFIYFTNWLGYEVCNHTSPLHPWPGIASRPLLCRGRGWWMSKIA